MTHNEKVLETENIANHLNQLMKDSVNQLIIDKYTKVINKVDSIAKNYYQELKDNYNEKYSNYRIAKHFYREYNRKIVNPYFNEKVSSYNLEKYANFLSILLPAYIDIFSCCEMINRKKGKTLIKK